jgi:hypothetical protein
MPSLSVLLSFAILYPTNSHQLPTSFLLLRSPQLTTHSQGIDDILGLLLALSAKAEEVEILLISLTFGNIEVRRFVLRHRRSPLSYNPTTIASPF